MASLNAASLVRLITVAISLALLLASDASSGLERAHADAAPAPPATLWQVPISGRGVPVADDRSVYFTSDDHELVAVDADRGTVEWRRRIGDVTAATSGSLLVVTGPLIVAGDYDVIAFERTTGMVRWRFHPSDGYGAGIYLGGAAAGIITAGSPAGRVYALDAGSGTVRWSGTVAAEGRTTVFCPVISSDRVVAAYTTFTAPPTGGVIAWRLDSGEELWRRPFPSSTPGSSRGSSAAGGPIVADGVVIAGDGLGTIHGLDIATGIVRWSIPWSPPMDAGRLADQSVEFRALATWGGTLFAASLHGTLIAYDLRTLKERWRYYDDGNGSAGFQIGIADGRLFVPFLSAGLVQLRTSDGQEMWRSDPAYTGLSWPPAVSGTNIYVASRSGLLALKDSR